MTWKIGRLCLWLAVILLIQLFSLSGCISQQPVKVGFTAELSGKQSDLGVNLREGVQLTVEEINAKGGIDGRQIEFIVEDDLGTPQGAQAAENKLIDAGVVAVVGHFTSDQTMAGYEVASARGMLLLNATASTSLLSGKKDLLFRTVVSTDALGKGFAKYVRQQRGLTRIAIIYDIDNDAYAVPLYQTFSNIFESMGGQITTTIKFSGAVSQDFSSLVDEVKSSKPEGILIIASPSNTAIIAQDIALKDWKVALFSSSWGQGETLIENGGKAVEGMEIMIGLDVNASTPELQSFKSAFQKRFAHSPAFTAVEGYETMQLLVMALNKTSGTATGLAEALLELKDFKGLTGPIFLDEYGDAIRPLFIQRVKDAKFVTITTVSISP